MCEHNTFISSNLFKHFNSSYYYHFHFQSLLWAFFMCTWKHFSPVWFGKENCNVVTGPFLQITAAPSTYDVILKILHFLTKLIRFYYLSFFQPSLFFFNSLSLYFLFTFYSLFLFPFFSYSPFFFFLSLLFSLF